MTASKESVRELTVAGVGAIVLPSLFEEQVVQSLVESGESPQAGELQTAEQHFEDIQQTSYGSPRGYLDLVAELKSQGSVPVIASLNGCTSGNWLDIATELEQAGADAFEVSLESGMLEMATSADTAEERLIENVREFCKRTQLPVSVKLSPFHTNVANLAWRLTEVGVAGIVCFAHDPEWDVRTDHLAATLKWSLTPAHHINQTLAGLIRLKVGGYAGDLAASGGVCSAEDLLKALIAGADVAMVTSELYRSGPGAVTQMVEGLSSFLDQQQLSSVADLAQRRPKLPADFRGGYLRSITGRIDARDPTPKVAGRGDRWGHPT